jgi:hypothetical protein
MYVCFVSIDFHKTIRSGFISMMNHECNNSDLDYFFFDSIFSTDRNRPSKVAQIVHARHKKRIIWRKHKNCESSYMVCMQNKSSNRGKKLVFLFKFYVSNSAMFSGFHNQIVFVRNDKSLDEVERKNRAAHSLLLPNFMLPTKTSIDKTKTSRIVQSRNLGSLLVM